MLRFSIWFCCGLLNSQNKLELATWGSDFFAGFNVLCIQFYPRRMCVKLHCNAILCLKENRRSGLDESALSHF
jgi:hypothetical protein